MPYLAYCQAFAPRRSVPPNSDFAFAVISNALSSNVKNAQNAQSLAPLCATHGLSSGAWPMRPWKACGFEPATLDRFTSMSPRSSISPLGFWSPVARHRSLLALSEAEGHPLLLMPASSTRFQLRFHRSPDTGPPASNSGFGSPVDSPGVQRPDFQPLEPTSPLEFTVTENALVSPVDSTLTKSLELNCRGMTFLQKIPGGVGVVARGKPWKIYHAL